MWIDLALCAAFLLMALACRIIWRRQHRTDTRVRRLNTRLGTPDDGGLDPPRSIQQQIADGRKKIDQLWQATVGEDGPVRRHASRIDFLAGRINEIENSIASAEQRIEEASRQRTGLMHDAEQAHERISKNERDVHKLLDQVGEYRDDIGDVTEEVRAQGRTIDHLVEYLEELRKSLWDTLINGQLVVKHDPRWASLGPAVREYVEEFMDATRQTLGILERSPSLRAGDAEEPAAAVDPSTLTDEGPITREDLEKADNVPFGRYQKTALVRVVRIEGPFAVKNREGTLHCADGYLALDSEGYPYPVGHEEFERIYRPA
jgi:archaellum component FlaC